MAGERIGSSDSQEIGEWLTEDAFCVYRTHSQFCREKNVVALLIIVWPPIFHNKERADSELSNVCQHTPAFVEVLSKTYFYGLVSSARVTCGRS